MKKTLITLAALAVASVASAEYATGITIDNLEYSTPFFAENAQEMTGLTMASDPTRLTGYSFTFSVEGDVTKDTMVAAMWNAGYSEGGARAFIIDGSTMTLNTTLGNISSTLGSDGSTTNNKFTSWTWTMDVHRATFVDDQGAAVQLAVGKTYTVSFASEAFIEGTDRMQQVVNLTEGGTVLGTATFVGNMGGNNGWATSMALKSVPEPATATLSLLALAGLAARRRRK